MKNKIYLLFIILVEIFISCNNKKNDQDSSLQTDSTKTLFIGKVQFNIQPITQAEFESNRKANKVQSENELLQKLSNVYRHSDSLIFKLKNNNQFVLVNDSLEESWAMYSYAGELKNIGYWYTDVFYYEWYNTILVNQNNGDTTITIGAPVVSPDNKYIICGNVDLLASFTINGFELYQLVNSKIQKIGMTELNDWGPSEIYWKDLDIIYIKQTRIDNNNNEYYTYCKLIKH